MYNQEVDHSVKETDSKMVELKKGLISFKALDGNTAILQSRNQANNTHVPINLVAKDFIFAGETVAETGVSTNVSVAIQKLNQQISQLQQFINTDRQNVSVSLDKIQESSNQNFVELEKVISDLGEQLKTQNGKADIDKINESIEKMMKLLDGHTSTLVEHQTLFGKHKTVLADLHQKFGKLVESQGILTTWKEEAVKKIEDQKVNGEKHYSLNVQMSSAINDLRHKFTTMGDIDAKLKEKSDEFSATLDQVLKRMDLLETENKTLQGRVVSLEKQMAMVDDRSVDTQKNTELLSRNHSSKLEALNNVSSRDTVRTNELIRVTDSNSKKITELSKELEKIKSNIVECYYD